MHFIRSVLLAAACSTLTLSVSAAPAPTSTDLSARDIEDLALERRVFGSLGKMLVGAQQGQARKQAKAETKKKANQKIASSVSRQRAPDHITAGKSSGERAKLHQSYTDKARDRAVTQAQKQSKADRASRWESSRGKSRSDRPSSSGRSKYTDHGDRARVSSSLRGGAERMHRTENIPHRADTFHVGGFTTSGRQVRQAVGHSIVHQGDPVGRGDSKAPKPFRNDPYGPSHPDSSIRGSRPVPNSGGRNLYEYPVTGSHSSHGYTGTGRPGPARVVTSHDDGRDVFHGVIGHDTGRGGSQDDHYLADYRPHAGSSFSSSRYRY